VHLARDLDEGGEVAVKLFDLGVTLDAAILEAQLQRRLSAHPRVVGLRNVDARTSAAPVVVTEYMPAGSVADRIGGGSAGLLSGLRWTLDAADALAHAHANGVFQRPSGSRAMTGSASTSASLSLMASASGCTTCARPDPGARFGRGCRQRCQCHHRQSAEPFRPTG
jgi:hypothetical protein